MTILDKSRAEMKCGFGFQNGKVCTFTVPERLLIYNTYPLIMGLNDSGRFSQTFLDAVKAERNQRYELASNAYAKEAGGIQQTNDLERSALCFLLAGRCKMQAKKNAREEFEKAASIYLAIARGIKNSSPMNSRMAYRCATRCFLRAELYDKAQEAQSSADSIKDVRGTEGEIK